MRTLIATDIAARGIDVEGISHVVNYDLPNIPESYVHRIGRTARAGADGIAISFCDAEERAFLRDIEKLIRMSIPATDRRSDRRAQPLEHANGGRARTSRIAIANQDRGTASSRNRQHQNGRPAIASRRADRQQRRAERPAAAPDAHA